MADLDARLLPEGRFEAQSLTGARSDFAGNGPLSLVSDRSSRGRNYNKVSHADFEPTSDRGTVIGGVLVSSYSRTPDFARTLSPSMQLKLRVWRVVHGPIEKGDQFGHLVHWFIQFVVIAFIVLVIVETERHLYNKYEIPMHHAGVVLATILTVEYVLSFWSVAANEPYASGHWLKARLDWACTFFPVIDVVVLISFWVNEVLREKGMQGSYAHKLVGVFQTLRLLRLMRILDLFEGGRAKKAFSMLLRVLQDKGEDLFAAVVIMFMSLIFIATVMYLVEGSRDADGIDGFSSIPVSMYWGIITLTTIGYGDISPKTSIGMTFCCFVAFYAVCIGSIPIGIIGAGYVEELARTRKEEKAAASRAHLQDRLLNDQRNGHAAVGDASTVAGSIVVVGQDGGKREGGAGGMERADDATVQMASLRLGLERAADAEFLAALRRDELSELSGLLMAATAELNDFLITELAVLRQEKSPSTEGASEPKHHHYNQQQQQQQGATGIPGLGHPTGLDARLGPRPTSFGNGPPGGAYNADRPSDRTRPSNV